MLLSRSMRATCAVLIAVLSFGGDPLVARAGMVEPEESAEQLYEDGRKAYRLGRYEEAVKKFERSFELSDQPLLLYNIALAYKRLYSISKDVADLRRSKNVFEEFITVAQADTALQTEIDDARARLAELDQEISDAEAAAAKSAPEPRPDTGDQPTIGPKERKLRIAGAATMGVGGALLIGGIAMGTFFIVRASGFANDIRLEKEAIGDPMCTRDRPIQMLPMGCPADRVRRLATFRDNARAARLGAGLGFGLMGTLGVAALVTGAVLFAKGTPRAGKGRVADLLVSPALDGSIVVSGRF